MFDKNDIIFIVVGVIVLYIAGRVVSANYGQQVQPGGSS
jgi:hypothetical protein